MFAQELELIYRTSPMGMALFDRDLRYVRINDKLAEINGREAAEVVGRTLREVIPDLADDLEPILRGVLETGEPVIDGEVTGGTEAVPSVERFFRHSFHPVQGIDGRIEGVSVLVNEVTELRSAEEEGKQAEERLKLTVAGSNDGMWDWPDVNRDEEWWSPRWYELLGYENGEVEASLSNFKAFLHPDDLEGTAESIRAHFEEHAPFDTEYRLRTKSGEYRWFRGRGQALWDQDGRPVRMSGSIQDITDRKHAEVERERYEAMVTATSDLMVLT